MATGGMKHVHVEDIEDIRHTHTHTIYVEGSMKHTIKHITYTHVTSCVIRETYAHKQIAHTRTHAHAHARTHARTHKQTHAHTY